LLNELLSDDVLDNGYVSEYPVSVTSILTWHKILKISFYLAFENPINAFGNHGRVSVFNTSPNYEHIVSEEASRSHIARLLITSEEPGKTLVLGEPRSSSPMNGLLMIRSIRLPSSARRVERGCL
jgi:hypothetical protein